MDFFKSVFADEPEPQRSDSDSESESNAPPAHNKPDQPPQSPNPNPNDGGGGSLWSGLMKTLTAKSESVIEIYRRDLMEFGTGLKKEIEVAHGSLENVSHKIDEIGSSVMKGTAQIISHGKDAILAGDNESDSDNSDRNLASQQSLNSKPYSRFDAQVRLIRGDINTFVEEPEDMEEYNKWRSGFNLEEKREKIESLIGENGELESMFKKLVPSNVDEENFWSRYYFRVYKLKQAEDLRANLVKRAISAAEEDLSWEVDDDEDENENINVQQKENDKKLLVTNVQSNSEDKLEIVKAEEKENVKEVNANVKEEKQSVVEESKGDKVENLNDKEESKEKANEEIGLGGKSDNGNSSKDSEFSVVASQQSAAEEDDLEWDEIEDMSSIDEKKVSHSSSTNTADLRKRLSAKEEEEDLSWDIEDDDDAVKS